MALIMTNMVVKKFTLFPVISAQKLAYTKMLMLTIQIIYTD